MEIPTTTLGDFPVWSRSEKALFKSVKPTGEGLTFYDASTSKQPKAQKPP
ncbi:MAG: hypothetical protein RMK50_07145 [Nitrososphaerota archaeon]|nr:hypothetical protein [Candidatus Bathyarchaeota archaeon]MDW8194574.1 hypothetical protein [Nitrososphaerota archaeon]